MLLFIPRSLCALKRVTSKGDSRFAATQGIRVALTKGLYRAEATDGRRAIVVQGSLPTEEPPWPGFKELPDDAFEVIVLPKDLDRACKIGGDYLQSRFGMVGIATNEGAVHLGLGSDVVTAPRVEGSFPPIERVIPTKKPLFTFRVDPSLLGETLLAVAALLPETECEVQFFYFGAGLPLGFCARNPENGNLIDALVVPISPPKKEKPTEPGANGSKASEPNGQVDTPPSNEQPAGETAPEPTEPKRTKKAK